MKLFAFHGNKPAIITVLEGTLKSFSPGIFTHTAGHVISVVDTNQFREFTRDRIEKPECGKCTVLRLRRHSQNLMLSIQEIGDFAQLPPITDLLQ